MDRREFVRGGLALLVGSAVSLSGIGCQEQFNCARDRWYWQKRKDLLVSVGSNDRAEDLVKKVICSAADKLGRAIYPDYLPFPDVGHKTGELKDGTGKKSLGVLDIYTKSLGGIAVFSDYVTQILTGACMSNLTLGENFRFVTRYKLRTILKEYDVRRSISDFDPRDAIKRGYFEGADSVLTGNIYSTKSVVESSGDSSVLRYKGGAQIILELIDVKRAEIVATATESIARNPLVNEWLKRETTGRY